MSPEQADAMWWRYNAIAAKKGGRLVTTPYYNSVTKLEWECKHGHRWMASPNNIQKGRWCPHCNGGGDLSKSAVGPVVPKKTGKSGMSIKEAMRIVRLASDARTQLPMSRNDWEQVNYARKILAERYLAVYDAMSS